MTGALRMLIVSSCTKAKMTRAQPAGTLYRGQQHRQMMTGVNTLRARFGHTAIVVRIVSAKYGVVTDEDVLEPYDTTFQGVSSSHLRARAEALNIPERIRTEIQGFPLVVFLLGDHYLAALDVPLPQERGQRQLFVTASVRDLGRGVRVPAGQLQSALFGGALTAVKGFMFKHAAAALCEDPTVFPILCASPDASAFLAACQRGRQLAEGVK